MIGWLTMVYWQSLVMTMTMLMQMSGRDPNDVIRDNEIVAQAQPFPLFMLLASVVIFQIMRLTNWLRKLIRAKLAQKRQGA